MNGPMMNFLDEALKLDVDQKIESAAKYYELAIQSDDPPIECYVNLAVLYWESTDFGFNTGHNLSPEFVHKAGDRYPLILNDAIIRFRDHNEVIFWQYYSAWISLGGRPFVKECLELVKDNDAMLTPYFYLYMQSGNPSYLPVIRNLAQVTKKLLTTKNRYIWSVLESSLKRYGHETLIS
jgi:hypothetical protein